MNELTKNEIELLRGDIDGHFVQFSKHLLGRIIKTIDCLVTENEELKAFKEIKGGITCAILQAENACALQPRLSLLESDREAIEKAWEPIKADMIDDNHIEFNDCYMLDADELKALDKAIRRKG